MARTNEFRLRAVGAVRSALQSVADAPRQGVEGAPDAWLELDEALAPALGRIVAGDDLIVVTWLHLARRDVLETYPRNDTSMPLTGVFATRSPDRPNPLGLHRVTVRMIAGSRLLVGPIEAVDGTPIVDIKAVLDQHGDS
jgi:tRNA-Thr(GGU) m(6)t(6)A37 methyltransferase TsaA